MNRLSLANLWMLVIPLLASAWGCATEVRLGDPTWDENELGRGSLWERMPRPDDAEEVEVSDEFDLGFATGMSEPELFDVYAAWLREQGWRQQAPAEAVVTLPHQVWRKDRTELLIEIQGLDKQGRTVVWFRLEEPRIEGTAAGCGSAPIQQRAVEFASQEPGCNRP